METRATARILPFLEGQGQALHLRMAAREVARQPLKARGSMEHRFILITIGDLLGVSILRPYYAL